MAIFGKSGVRELGKGGEISNIEENRHGEGSL